MKISPPGVISNFKTIGPQQELQVEKPVEFPLIRGLPELQDQYLREPLPQLLQLKNLTQSPRSSDVSFANPSGENQKKQGLPGYSLLRKQRSSKSSLGNKAMLMESEDTSLLHCRICGRGIYIHYKCSKCGRFVCRYCIDIFKKQVCIKCTSKR